MRLLTIVAQIPRRCLMKRLVDQQADLELNSKDEMNMVLRCSIPVFLFLSGQQILDVVREFLQFFNLEYSLAVFNAEADCVSIESSVLKRTFPLSLNLVAVTQSANKSNFLFVSITASNEHFSKHAQIFLLVFYGHTLQLC